MKKTVLLSLLSAVSLFGAGSEYAPYLKDKAPQTEPVAIELGIKAPANVKKIFISGPEYKGHPTKIFAWYGLPKVEPGKKVPGIVLVHGSWGTPGADWVKMWNDRGFAAIAVGTGGTLPKPSSKSSFVVPKEEQVWVGGAKKTGFRFHKFSGPFEFFQKDRKDWNFHATVSVLLANNFLRSLPEVDKSKVGIFGISQGGMLSCRVIGMDPRFAFAVPIYCVAKPDFRPDLAKAKMPIFFSKGCNDAHCPNRQYEEGTSKPQGKVYRRLLPVVWHSEPSACAIKEIYPFVDSVVFGKPGVARALDEGRDGDKVWCEFEAPVKLISAKLVYSDIAKDDAKKKWKECAATVQGSKVSAVLPAGAKEYFLYATDQNKMRMSGRFHVVQEGK